MATGLVKTGLLAQQLLSKSVAGSANVALTAAEAQGGLLTFTGTLTGSIQVSVPAALNLAGAFWVVYNNTSGSFTLTFIGATGSGIVVRQGTRALIGFDGTNMVRLSPDVENDGDLSPVQVVDSAGNAIIRTGVNQLAFFGVAAASRPSAYTQTYATADKTHANPTSAILTDSTGGSADTTVADVTGAHDQTILNNNFADLTAQINALRVDLLDAKQALNSVIDDLQTLGLVQ